MKSMKSVLFCSVLTALSACSSTPSSNGGGDFESDLAATQAALTALDKKGGAWRDTQDMLDDAKKAMASNDAATANKKLSAAKSEVEMATAQLAGQQNAGPTMF